MPAKRVSIRMHGAVTAAGAALLLTACGSTVQQQSAPASPDGLTISDDGLSPVSGGVADAPVAAVGDGSAADSTSGSAPAGAGAAGVPSAGGSSSAPSAGTAAGAAPAVAGASGGGPVQVGFFVAKDLGPATKSLGVDGLATGNGLRQAEATAKLLNSSGGIAGRRVVPVIFEYDVSQNAQTQFQAACSLFLEDNKVIGVVSVLLDPVLSGCTESRGSVLVTSGNRAPAQEVLDRFRHTLVPSQMPLESVVTAQIASLHEQGWFRPGSPAEQIKIGLLHTDAPDFAQVPSLAAAALRRSGLTLEMSHGIPLVDDTSQVAAASSAGSNGVLRFRGAGINRVVVVDKSGQAISYFAIAAQNQSYYPTFGISSLELPSLLPTLMSPRQLEGARGIGFAPLYDVPLNAQPPANANVKACLSAMQGAGEDMSSAGTRALALTTCDGGLTLSAAMRSGDLSRAGFLSGLKALGRSHAPVMTPAADFGAGRAPASGYRTIAYAASCSCFQYSGEVQPVRR